jgi:hypothetical protein
MAGRRKPAHLRANTETIDIGMSVPLTVVKEVPEADPEWEQLAKDRWAAYWRSPLSKLVQLDADLPGLRHLFNLYNWRSQNGYDRHVNAEILRYEDRFGLSPKARLSLGITVDDKPAAGTLPVPDGADDDGGADDPRLHVLDGRTG